MKLTIAQIATATGGKIVDNESGSKSAKSIRSVVTDSRKNCSESLFVALKGEIHDAHKFVGQAVDNGAAAILVSEMVDAKGVTQILVADTLKALQDLASYWRHLLKAQVIGVTGTNGKTTTKDFARTLISTKFKTCATIGNLNNFIGLPLSILSMREDTDVGIFEMGLSVADEMKTLVKVADPDIVLVTSVGRAHLLGLGTLEAVAANKEQIYTCAKESAVRIFNLDNPYTEKMREKVAAQLGAKSGDPTRVLTFSSTNPEATVSFRENISTIEFLEVSGTIAGEPGTARVPIFGRHNITNLMAAACLALAAGVEPDHIWKALPNCKGYWGRNQLVKLKSGALALFDGYNANPESVEALLKNVSRLAMPGKLFGVFGDMLELGPNGREWHLAWGQQAAKLGFDFIWFIGENGETFREGLKMGGFKKSITVSTGYEDSLALEVRNMLNAGDTVLVKGSRGMKLERVVAHLDPFEFSTSAKN